MSFWNEDVLIALVDDTDYRTPVKPVCETNSMFIRFSSFSGCTCMRNFKKKLSNVMQWPVHTCSVYRRWRRSLIHPRLWQIRIQLSRVMEDILVFVRLASHPTMTLPFRVANTRCSSNYDFGARYTERLEACASRRTAARLFAFLFFSIIWRFNFRPLARSMIIQLAQVPNEDFRIIDADCLAPLASQCLSRNEVVES